MTLSGLATGIGSLPHKDVDYAIRFIFDNFKNDIIFWPQMVNFSFKENMYTQFSEGLPNIKIQEDKMFFDIKEGIFTDEFFENIDNLDYFKISKGFACGFYKMLDYLKRQKERFNYLKGQITGPITFGLKVTDQNLTPSIYNDELAQIITIHLTKKTLWQIDKLKDFCHKVIIFIDEPYLSSVGSAYVQLDKEFVIENLNYVINEIKSTNTLVGTHCCANTDWSILFKTNLDIISFDAYEYFGEFSLYIEELKKFLDRGGIIAYGIVPANNRIEDESPGSIFKKLNDEFEILIKAGLNKDKVLGQFILTPSCGLGSLKEELAENILKTTIKIKELLKEDEDCYFR